MTVSSDIPARYIVETLRSSGYQAYWAGGCVRDRLRNIPPKDYDVATSAKPDDVLKLFDQSLAVGAAFGVIVVRREGHSIEVATFRTDSTYSDGRHPDSVTFSTPRDDALRRDFTINGMFFDPVTEEIIDFVGGQEDLKARLIRCIGRPEQRFSEDALRLLRCIRFASVLDFTIEKETWDTLCRLSGQVTRVSVERIRDEITRILTGPHPGNGLDLLDQSGLLAHIIPECLPLKGCPQPPQWHPEGDVWTHTKIMLNLLNKPSPELAWSVLLHDIAKPDCLTTDRDGRIRHSGHESVGAEKAVTLLQRLRFSNDFIKRVHDGVRYHMQFKDVSGMKPSTLKRMMARETFAMEMELHRVDCLSSHGKLDNYHFLEERQNHWEPEEIKPSPLITGHDLIAMGFVPGPSLGKVLDEIQELQLDGALSSRGEALEYLRKKYPPKSEA